MRTLSANLLSAINVDAQRLYADATIYTAKSYLSSIVETYKVADAEAAGPSDYPIPQDFSLSGNGEVSVTFYHHGGHLKYTLPGNSAYVDTMLDILGKPACYGGGTLSAYLWVPYDDGANGTVRGYIVHWSELAARDATPFTHGYQEYSSGSAVIAIHAVADNKVVLVREHQDALEFSILKYSAGFTENRWSGRVSPNRMMEYDSSGSGMTTTTHAQYIAASDDADGNTYIYWSDPATGSIHGVKYDTTYGWTDSFVALPIDKKASLCETKVCGSYTGADGATYVSALLWREDAVGTAMYYNLIMRSTDGVAFNISRDSLVSSIGYRFITKYYSGTIYLANSNRVGTVSHAWLTGAGTASQNVVVPAGHIIDFEDTNMTEMNMRLANAGGLYSSGSVYSYLAENNVAKVRLGMMTASGIEYIDYGQYRIAAIDRSISDAANALTVKLIGDTQHQLTQGALPFYTEYLGKQHIVVDTYNDEGVLYNAGVAYLASTGEARLSIDFWKMDEWTDSGSSAPTPTVSLSNGAPKYVSSGSFHDIIFSSGDLKDVLGLSEYPELTSGDFTAYLAGWAYPDESTNNTDIVELGLELERADGTRFHWYSNADHSFRRTYPVDSGITHPYYDEDIAIVVSGDVSLSAGLKIVRVGMRFTCDNKTVCMPARVDFYTGVSYLQSFIQPSLPWKKEEIYKSGIEVQGYGVPQIMFSPRPYDTTDFRVQGIFWDDLNVTWNDADFPAGYGLVGLASDANNYWVGRVNRGYQSSGSAYWQIVQVVDGFEYLREYLAWDADGFGSHPGGQGNPAHLILECRDGILRLYCSIAGKYELVLSHTIDGGLLGTDPFACKSDVPLKVGIYGIINPPSFRLASRYSPDKEDDYASSDCLACLPADSAAFSELPSSGTVLVGHGEMQYTSKVNASRVRGPYNFIENRFFGDDGYANKNGVRCTLFNYVIGDETYAGAISREDGAYINAGFEGVIIGGDTDDDLFNSAIMYSDNPNVARDGKSGEKIYVADYLNGISVVKDTGYLRRGDWVYLKPDGHVVCSWFAASSICGEETVHTLTEKVAAMTGATIEYPGVSSGSSSITATPDEVVMLYSVDSVDYLMEISGVSNDKYMKFSLSGMNAPDDGPGIDIIVTSKSTGFTVQVDYGTGAENDVLVVDSIHASYSMRLFAMKDHISVYLNNKYVHTFHCANMEWAGDEVGLMVSTNNATAVTLSYVARELSDYREAVYIDLESSGDAGIQAIVQERPLEITTNGGLMQLVYYPTRDVITPDYSMRQVSKSDTGGAGVFSDYIIYGKINTGVYQDATAIPVAGMKTKVLKVPNLETGALKAAEKIADRAYESRIKYSVKQRPDLRIEQGDYLDIVETLANGETVGSRVIVEGIKCINGEMQIQGRHYMTVSITVYSLDFSDDDMSMYVSLV